MCMNLHIGALLLSFATFAVGCAKPPPAAPVTIDELSVALLRDFETTGDEEHVTAQALTEWLLVHVDEQDGFSLADIAAEDVAAMPYDGGEDGDPDLSMQQGIAVTHRVPGTLEQHVAIVPEADQSFADPSYQTWDRTIVEGDAESFAAGEGLVTDNVIEKASAFNVVIPYGMGKDYRWITLDMSDVGGDAETDTLIFRSWVKSPGWQQLDDPNAEPQNGLVYGWTIELWVPNPDGELIWYNASWCWLKTVIDDVVDPDYLVQEVIKGTVDYMDGTGAHATGADQM